MKDFVSIVIPSYKRAGTVEGYEYFKTAKIVVPEAQRDEYASFYDVKRLIVIPDDCDGSIGKKRNWILANIPRPLLMIDDDVSGVTMTEGGEAFKVTGKAQQMIPVESKAVSGIIDNIFNMAFEAGCVMCGINVNTDGRNYQQYVPFSFKNMILGPFCGHLDHDLKYDLRMGSKEDYDMCLQVLNKHRKIFRSNKYAYNCKHGDNKGGIVSMRSMEKEVSYARAIEKKWGKKIISYPENPKKMSEILNGRVNVPIGGI